MRPRVNLCLLLQISILLYHVKYFMTSILQLMLSEKCAKVYLAYVILESQYFQRVYSDWG